jgi:glycerol-3-phosphate dehydrogenase
MNNLYDVFVIGGGVNGCGVARDAAGRGYSVYLAEKNDIASGTSSASSKLIHGGLRYLENFEFSLVRASLRERDILLKIAPHIIKEMRFILPHHNKLRPIWLLKLGMLLYDNLYSSKYIKRSSYIRLPFHESKSTLTDAFKKGFEYSDCITDDARLTVLNATDAKRLGGNINTRTIVKNMEQKKGVWNIEVLNTISNETKYVQAKVVVNATGPWIDNFLKNYSKQTKVDNIRLVKGSHIVVKKLFNHSYSYVFQNSDGRIFFAVPWENEFTFIGTTDVDFKDNLDSFSISDDEINYLCKSANQYFRSGISSNDVIKHWSGVRPLNHDGSIKAQKASRDYTIKIDSQDNKSALINIFGGKMTTFRQLSETVVNKVGLILGEKKSPWSSDVHLPGGDFSLTEKTKIFDGLAKKYDYLDVDHIQRLFNLYGTRVEYILKNVSSIEDLGLHFGRDLYQVEVDYLMQEEFALYPEDVLERRTKLYLFLDYDKLENLHNYMQKKRKVRLKI